MNVKIGTKIKVLRKEQKVTQEDLAAAIGVTPQAISRWEGEGGYPDIELLPAIADFFAVSLVTVCMTPPTYITYILLNNIRINVFLSTQ